MTPVAVWRRCTEPTTDGELSRRREAVLFSVLAGMVVVACLTLALQLSSLSTAEGQHDLAWVGMDVVAGAAFAGLLVAARRGHHRPVALALVGFLGSLALLLLLSDGTDAVMWALLLAFALVIATVLLGGRAALGVLGMAAAGLLPVIVLQDAGTLEPFGEDDGAEGEGSLIVTGVEVLLLVGFLVGMLSLYTRDVLPTIDEQLTHGSEQSPLRALRTRALSMREVEVVQLVAEGLSNDAIASRLFLSPRTVHTHVSNAMRKCDCSNRTELGVLAVREGLVPLQDATPAASSSRS